MNRASIRSKAARLIDKANKMFKTNIKHPKVIFYDKGTNAGWAESVSNVLAFNEILAEENPTEFKDIVIHEVAHIVTDNIFPNALRTHGKEFQVICRALGGTGEASHTMDVSSVKLSYNRKKVKKIKK